MGVHTFVVCECGLFVMSVEEVSQEIPIRQTV